MQTKSLLFLVAVLVAALDAAPLAAVTNVISDPEFQDFDADDYDFTDNILARNENTQAS